MTTLAIGMLAIGLTWLLWPEPAEQAASTKSLDEGARLEAAPGPAPEVEPSRREPASGPSPGPAANGAPPREVVPESASAELTDRAGRRFQVRWSESGLCGPGDARRVGQRPSLLGTFVALDAGGTTVRHDPQVDPVVLREVLSVLGAVQSPAQSPLRGIFGHEFDRLPPPEVYVYRDVRQMMEVSCVNRSAIGYYDGAIHLSGDTRHGIENVKKTVIHEYVHHVLIGLGIQVPMWLHEGLAMKLANETWWVDSSLGLVAWLRSQHLPFEAMTGAFPHTADEKFALAAYYQSFAMVEFLQARQGDEGVAALVRALARGELSAREAFSSTGLSGDALEQAWREFLARRHEERDNPMQQLHEAATRDRQ